MIAAPEANGDSERVATETVPEIVRRGHESLLITQTPRRAADVAATVTIYQLKHPDAEMAIQLISALNGERWVEARRIESRHALLQRIDGRLRLTIDATAPRRAQ